MHINNYARKSQMVEGYSQDRHDMVDVRLLECNSATKKRKVKDELMYMDDHDQEGQGQSQSQLDDVYVKSVGKRRWADEISMENMISEANVMDIAEEDAELETKTQKKPFTLITPTVHTGFHSRLYTFYRL
ncbi:putative nuclear factor related to kappa-B-binding protein [Helianthus annuus]|nr:putative nuclear factor related to kappa-B-binding protein [Helianthus annuus]